MFSILFSNIHRQRTGALALVTALVAGPLGARQGPTATLPLFDLDTPLVSRSISFENPTGAPGAGGAAASPLGVGRKGAPARMIQPGETVRLADIEGPGTLRHLWMTTLPIPAILRSFVVRVWWEGQEHPSIELPLGELAGFAHGAVTPFQSALHSVGENAGINLWIEMPFAERARLEIENEGRWPAPLFYQIDYTLGDRHPEQLGRLHALFRRENPTREKQDFEILPERRGRGVYLGTVIGVRVRDQRWWGEGELKVYLDGDGQADGAPSAGGAGDERTGLATIVGTGAEDYVGVSFGMQETPFLYNGASYDRDSANGSHYTSMYRWHLKDPIHWHQSIRVTLQQIGHKGESFAWDDYPSQLYERSDDWSCATFWYEAIPSAPLPPIPDVDARIADLPTEMGARWLPLWQLLERSVPNGDDAR